MMKNIYFCLQQFLVFTFQPFFFPMSSYILYLHISFTSYKHLLRRANLYKHGVRTKTWNLNNKASILFTSCVFPWKDNPLNKTNTDFLKQQQIELWKRFYNINTMLIPSNSCEEITQSVTQIPSNSNWNNYFRHKFCFLTVLPGFAFIYMYHFYL